jgi:hypothetical protein
MRLPEALALNVVHVSQYTPHRVRSAKPAGNTGMASGPGSRTNRR